MYRYRYAPNPRVVSVASKSTTSTVINIIIYYKPEAAADEHKEPRKKKPPTRPRGLLCELARRNLTKNVQYTYIKQVARAAV